MIHDAGDAPRHRYSATKNFLADFVLRRSVLHRSTRREILHNDASWCQTIGKSSENGCLRKKNICALNIFIAARLVRDSV